MHHLMFASTITHWPKFCGVPSSRFKYYSSLGSIFIFCHYVSILSCINYLYAYPDPFILFFFLFKLHDV